MPDDRSEGRRRRDAALGGEPSRADHAISVVALADAWALRAMKICGRGRVQLPPFARDLVDVPVEGARCAAPA